MNTNTRQRSEEALGPPVTHPGASTTNTVCGVPTIGDPGRAAREVRPGRPFTSAGAPDHSLSEFNLPGLEIRAASVRGLMHRHRTQPRQDEYSVTYHPDHDCLLVVVCDGVGSLPDSYTAALGATRDLPALYWPSQDLALAIEQVNEALRQEDLEQRRRQQSADHAPDNLDVVDKSPEAPETRDPPPAPTMATTLTALALTRHDSGFHADLAWVGDSPAWHLSSDGDWSKLTDVTTPDSHSPLHTGSTRAIPSASVSCHRRTTTISSGAIFLMTDGVGVSVENSPDARDVLRTWWARPPHLFDFGRQVSFARKTQVDDRTVVGLWLWSEYLAP